MKICKLFFMIITLLIFSDYVSANEDCYSTCMQSGNAVNCNTMCSGNTYRPQTPTNPWDSFQKGLNSGQQIGRALRERNERQNAIKRAQDECYKGNQYACENLRDLLNR